MTPDLPDSIRFSVYVRNSVNAQFQILNQRPPAAPVAYEGSD
jgi:hypothetical protein